VDDLADDLAPAVRASETAGETPPPGVRAGSEASEVGDGGAPEVLDHVYRPLIEHLEAECRRVLAAAETEAERIRSNAHEEARRILTDAHRERSASFRRASAKQASMYEEAESEIQRWLEELDEERQSVLETAHDDAARILRAAVQHAETDVEERRAAADREAQAIVAEARLEAVKYHAPVGSELEGVAPDDAVPPPATSVTTGAWLPTGAAVVPEREPEPEPSPSAEVDVPEAPAEAATAPGAGAPPPVNGPAEDALATAEPPCAEAPPEPVSAGVTRPPVGLADFPGLTDEPEPEPGAALPEAVPPEAAPAPVEAVPPVSLSRRERRTRSRFGFKTGR
jgi:F0F1-type ATP synthase membrane subunit b/b'